MKVAGCGGLVPPRMKQHSQAIYTDDSQGGLRVRATSTIPQLPILRYRNADEVGVDDSGNQES